MEEGALVAEVGRRSGKSVARQLRRDGKVPAVVYGLGADSLSVAVPDHDLQLILQGPSGSNTLINLQVEGGQSELVLARQIQRHPVRHHLIHVDLIRVRRDVAISAEVPVHLVGEARGHKDGGLVSQLIFTLSIEAKPADVPPSIEVDITHLGIGDHLSVADLPLPPGVVTTQDPDEQVVHVSQPRGLLLPEEEEAAAAAAEEEAEAGEAEAAEAEAGGGGEASGEE